MRRPLHAERKERGRMRLAVGWFGSKSLPEIAYAIPKLALPEDVALAFSILVGKTSFSDEGARQLLEVKIRLSPAELSVSTEGWSKAAEWAKFWQRPKILKLYCVAHKEMTDAKWAVCPKTTNACGSQNKISHPKSSSSFAALQALYRTDRRSAYYNASAKRGITTDVSDRKRRITKQKKLRRNNRPKLVDDDDGDDVPPSTSSKELPKKVRGFIELIFYKFILLVFLEGKREASEASKQQHSGIEESAHSRCMTWQQF